MVVRPSLEAREDREVDLGFQVVQHRLALLVEAALAFAVEDHCAARAAQGLVGSSGHDIGMVEWGRNYTRRNQTKQIV